MYSLVWKTCKYATRLSLLARTSLVGLNSRNFTNSAQNNCSTGKDKFSSPIPEFQNNPQISSYEDLYKFSIQNPGIFWDSLARTRLDWFRIFDQVEDCNIKEGSIKWFLNGKINVSGRL